ncbi:MAG TPA: DUF2339 domain-containing protein [Kofleriaceae bacterium]|nr:DUF2339 domain-containing protein [Kofleriaceae bacterium]
MDLLTLIVVFTLLIVGVELRARSKARRARGPDAARLAAAHRRERAGGADGDGDSDGAGAGRSEVGLEEWFGRQWATWLGALALLGAGGYYFQLAAGHGSFSPTAKLAIALAAGAVATLIGDRMIRRDARLLGQALLGVGLGLGFGATYAGFATYELYGAHAGALAMIAITVAGMTLAVRRDAPVVAFLAVLGGYLTPALASDGGGSRDVLFAYLLVLDVGVLGVALLRRWRALEILAGAGTGVLFAAWYHVTDAPGVAGTLAWCIGFGALFVTLPLAHHLRRRIALSVARILMAIVAGVVTFACGCVILHGGSHQVALLALGIAAAYLLVAVITRRRLPGDQLAHAAFAVTSAAFATLALPFELRGHGLALAWAVEGPVLLALGAHYRLTAVRHLGAGALLLAVGRLFVAHWPLHTGPVTPFLNLELAGPMLVVASAALYAFAGRHLAAAFLDRRGRWLADAAGVLAALLAIGLVDRELAFAGAASSAPGAGWEAELVWWLTLTGAALASTRAFPRLGRWTAAGACTVAAGLALAVLTLPAAGVPFVNLGFLLPAVTCVAVGLVVACFWPAREVTTSWQFLAVVGAAIALWSLASHEAWAHVRAGVDDPDRARWLGLAALSCTWSVMAGVALVLGFVYRKAGVRQAALAMFGGTVVKVLAVDLPSVQQGYRVLSLAVLGVLLLGASWLYHRVRRT